MMARKSKRGGFTLVEMLTVLVIIGILASMIAGAVMFALSAVGQTVVRQEISQLEAALNTYKTEYGEYPPDNSGDAYNHIVRCYRNIDKTHAQEVAKEVNPATALYIFLGPKSANPVKPFLWSPKAHQTSGMVDFDRTRLRLSNGGEVSWGGINDNGQICSFIYLPRGMAQPYIYFRANFTNKGTTYDGKNYNGAVAYGDKNGLWYGDRSFQIITAGPDNIYHEGSSAKVDDELGKADLDNVVSFSTRQIRDLLD